MLYPYTFNNQIGINRFSGSNIRNKTNKIAFKSSMRAYDNIIKNTPAGSQVYTSTVIGRECLHALELVKYAIEHFKDKPKVNIICLGGSDGSEAYTLSVILHKLLTKEECKKFKPIISIDKDEEITKAAQSGRINLSDKDFERLEQLIGSKTKYFVSPQEPLSIKYDLIAKDAYKSYKPIPVIRDSVKFIQDDILNVVQDLKDDGNSIVLCRNVMPYLHPSHISHIAYYINENLKPGSLFGIGSYDLNTDIRNYLYYHGFSEVVPNLFQRNSEPTLFQ